MGRVQVRQEQVALDEPLLLRNADFPVGALAGWKTGATEAPRFMVPMPGPPAVGASHNPGFGAARPCGFAAHPENGRKVRAFTLLELMVVISIMGVLAALMVPAVKGMRKMNDLQVASRQLQDDLGFARLRAITERTTVYVLFVPASITDPNLMAQMRSDPDRRSLRIYTNLARGQYTSYALYADRRLGDQPGQKRPRYLTEWKSLPEGVFIATNKFMNWSGNRDQFVRTPSLQRPFLVHAGKRFLFPHENGTYDLALPYLAFDWQGQLVYPVYPDNWKPIDQDEVIPLARGSIFYLRAANGNFLPADVVEVPPGNSTDTYNRIRINWLTGRTRVERPEMQ